MSRRFLLVAGLAALVAAVVPQVALAQFYKGKTVTMIINYPAGGPSDIEGRIIASICPRTCRESRRSSSRMWAAPAA